MLSELNRIRSGDFLQGQLGQRDGSADTCLIPKKRRHNETADFLLQRRRNEVVIQGDPHLLADHPKKPLLAKLPGLSDAAADNHPLRG